MSNEAYIPGEGYAPVGGFADTAEDAEKVDRLAFLHQNLLGSMMSPRESALMEKQRVEFPEMTDADHDSMRLLARKLMGGFMASLYGANDFVTLGHAANLGEAANRHTPFDANSTKGHMPQTEGEVAALRANFPKSYYFGQMLPAGLMSALGASPLAALMAGMNAYNDPNAQRMLRDATRPAPPKSAPPLDDDMRRAWLKGNGT